MIKFTINGRSAGSGDLGESLMQAVAEQVAAKMHERIGSIRDPETGEFPTVLPLGDTLERMSFRIEGSAKLLELVRERLGEDSEAMSLVEIPRSRPKKAFLSYAFEDSGLAEQIAKALMASGIDTWWAEWSIQPGDSLRQKIDEGLSDCTHFLVLLTPDSVKKPWVNAEMDAGFIRKIQNQARFIPLRACGLTPNQLPPLLQCMLSPSIENFEDDIRRLVNAIYELSRKPPLGPVPSVAVPPQTGYSPAATAIAKFFVEHSETALLGDPSSSVEDLVANTGLSEDDVNDGLYELHGMVKVDLYYVWAEEELFASFDKHFTDWDPAEDALRLAADLLNDNEFPNEPSQIAEHYGWSPRRLNPAIAYLDNRKLISCLHGCGTAPWVAFCVERTDATRRFVRSRC